MTELPNDIESLKALIVQLVEKIAQLEGELFRLMTEHQKQQLANNIVEGLVQANSSVQERMLAQFQRADANYAQRVKAAMSELVS
jgi:catalase